ncbi:MAG TPA: SGNH/GDSL hydrolase family protein [Candidatus Saccharimonadales bacterium]|nr:SGNH/GDSL hydrolase family protein [Candidatus Saccharimonadales bacterium]
MNNQERGLGDIIMPRRVFCKAVVIATGELLYAGSIESSGQSALALMEKSNLGSRDLLDNVTSPKVLVTSSMKNGKTFIIDPAGDSLGEEECRESTDPAFDVLVSKVSSDLYVSISSTNGYLNKTAQLGATSDQTWKNLKENLPEVLRSQSEVIYITSFGANDVLGLFMGDDSIKPKIQGDYTEEKIRIDAMLANFSKNARKIYHYLLKDTNGQYATLPPQAIALLMPNITQLLSVQQTIEQSLPELSSVFRLSPNSQMVIEQMVNGATQDFLEVVDYAVLGINRIIVELSQEYNKENIHLAFLNLYNQKIEKDEVCTDGIHPNKKGYNNIEEQLARLFLYKNDL